MADTAISAATAVASIVGATEFAVNEAGASKKCSATQIAAFVSPAASDTVAGVLEIAVQSEQETGTDVVRVVTPGRQQFHPSAAKFWGDWDGGTTVLKASYNVASVANTAVGDADVTLTTSFSGADWCGIMRTQDSTDGWDAQECQNSGLDAQAAGTFGVLCSTITDGNTAVCVLTDPQEWHTAGFGDQ